MKKILVIGSINVDIVFNTYKLPEKGETIFSKSFEQHFGGKGANQAFTVGKLGGDVELLGIIGDDNYGPDSLNNLKVNGLVNVDNILVSKQKPTGLANIVVASNGDNHIIVNSGANFEFTRDYIERAKTIIDKKDIIIFQLEIPLEVVEELVIYAKSKGKTTILDPAPAQLLSDQMLAHLDYLTPNETEMGVLAGKYVENEEEAINVAKVFTEKHHIPHMIVTLGELGSYYINREVNYKIPSYKVEAVDSTCAGDSYLGAFALKLSQGAAIKDALDFAARVSAIVVTRHGAQSSIPSIEEVEKFNF